MKDQPRRSVWSTSLKISAQVAATAADTATCGAASAAVAYVFGIVDEMREDSEALAKRVLERRVGRLEGKLGDGVIDNGELTELVLKMIHLSGTTICREKIELAAEVVARAIASDEGGKRISFSQAEFLLNVVRELPIYSFHVLGKAREQVRNMELRFLKDEGYSTRIDFRRLRTDLEGIDEDFLMGLLSELARFNLINMEDPPSIRVGGKYDQSDMKLTPLGYQLIQMLAETGRNQWGSM